MLFNSFVFCGLFLPCVLLAFWMAGSDRWRRAILLGSSLLFYGYFHWPYLVLLASLVGVAWACALWAERTDRSAPVWVAAGLLLGVLAYYKYGGFLETIARDIGALDATSRRLHDVALPIGISFIVFQALGYVVDVHRREFAAERRYSVVLLFKAFFPQLIAGPICRAHELIPQIKGRFVFRPSQVLGGLGIFVVGLLLKEVFADGLAPLVDKLYGAGPRLAGGDAWAAALGFGMQIYADFWAYSTMAVGLARMFGVDIPVNFRLPYLATSLREFWRRWHITLSQWLRDYLYKPLGGSRHGQRRTIFALMATMLLGGLWHGANYTFLIWGFIHGAAQVVEHLLRRGPRGAAEPSITDRVAGWVWTTVVVAVAWVFFRAPDVHTALDIVKTMFVGGAGVSMPNEVRQVAVLGAALFLLQLPIERLLAALREERVPAMAVGALSVWCVAGAVVLGAPAAVPFIYFQF